MAVRPQVPQVTAVFSNTNKQTEEIVWISTAAIMVLTEAQHPIILQYDLPHNMTFKLPGYTILPGMTLSTQKGYTIYFTDGVTVHLDLGKAKFKSTLERTVMKNAD